MNLTVTLTRPAFNDACTALSQEDADTIARTFPHMFRDFVTFGPFNLGDPADAPTKPGPAKTRPPAAPIDKDALAKAVLVALERHPKQRSEDYANKLPASEFGATAETIMPAVKKILEGMVTAKTAYCEGSGRGRRYHLAPAKAAESESAE